MQRLIEQLADDGDVLNGPTRVGRVHYHLSMYQHFPEAMGELVPAGLEVEGHIRPIDQLDLGALHRRRAELTLRLADGRRLDFLLATEEGAIHSTGRGLYEP